jgi:hypothetical protein
MEVINGRTQTCFWWDLIIEHFCFELYVELSSYNDEELYQILLGKTV